MEGLKIPYGLNNSSLLVSAKNASKEESYTCPSCNSKLTYRAGDIRSKHFSHSAESNCSIESILHKTAKLLIKNAIKDNSLGIKTLTLRNSCHSCGVEFPTELPVNTFSDAKEEVYVAEYICDVVGYRGDHIALGIEILNTHKVDEQKAEGLPIYWIELKAEDVITNPLEWNPIQSRLKSSVCKSCKSDIKHTQEIADKWKVDPSLYSPIKNPNTATYIADTEICFACKEEIPIFWWSGVPFCEIEPPLPRPNTIKYRHSQKYGGSYWANTCANCSMIQGDNFLFLFDNAPLRGLPLSNQNTKKSDQVTVVGGDQAVSEFMKVINRSFP